MSKPAFSVKVFGVYLSILGIGLTLIPNLCLASLVYPTRKRCGSVWSVCSCSTLASTIGSQRRRTLPRFFGRLSTRDALSLSLLRPLRQSVSSAPLSFSLAPPIWPVRSGPILPFEVTKFPVVTPPSAISHSTPSRIPPQRAAHRHR